MDGLLSEVRLVRSVMLTCAVLAAVALLSPVWAASDLDRQDCNTENPDLMIRGCTRLIEDPIETTEDRALKRLAN
jgi:hypothetical protein